MTCTRVTSIRATAVKNALASSEYGRTLANAPNPSEKHASTSR